MTTPARILVVDDEPGMRRAIERVLGRSHHVVGSPSSAAAIEVAAKFRPELAILDIRMPELDGFELMARLVAAHPGLDIILMTGSVDDLDEKLIRAIRAHAFYFIQKPFDREVLLTLVERCLELRWRREAQRRHTRRLETELAEARAFQQGLLPRPEAIANGLAISCCSLSCSELGGDLCDYAAVSTGATALLVADVCGHGVSAAMLTGVVKAAFHSSRDSDYAPALVVERVWRGLSAFGAERFVTLICALMLKDGGRLEYVNAGHPAGLLWRADGSVARLESTGPFISPVIERPCWDASAVPMAIGDQVLLYTDGISEALAEDDRPGEEGLVAAIRRRREGGRPLLDVILSEVTDRLAPNPQPDDLTLLTACRRD